MMGSERATEGKHGVHAIETGLPKSARPLFEWATLANETLYTAQIPIDSEGILVAGGIEAQATQVFNNLHQTLTAAGVMTCDVAQVLIYVTDRAYLPAVNAAYLQHFGTPLPNRASFVVSGLAREEMLVELVVYAQVRSCE